jgi:hypothetical protein
LASIKSCLVSFLAMAARRLEARDKHHAQPTILLVGLSRWLRGASKPATAVGCGGWSCCTFLAMAARRLEARDTRMARLASRWLRGASKPATEH